MGQPLKSSPCTTCSGAPPSPKIEFKADNPWGHDAPAGSGGATGTKLPPKADVIELRPTPQILTEPIAPIDMGAARHNRMRQEYEARRVQERRDKMAIVQPAGTSLSPLGNSSLILDENALIALERRADGRALDAGHQVVLDKLKDHEVSDLRVPEAVRNKRGDTLEQFSMTADRNSAEYKEVLGELEKYKVGRSKGVEDRQIVADTFFAQTEPGVKPVLLTSDKGIYNPLLLMSGRDPVRLGAPAAEAFPNGFDVTVKDRTITVLPVPRSWLDVLRLFRSEVAMRVLWKFERPRHKHEHADIFARRRRHE